MPKLLRQKRQKFPYDDDNHDSCANNEADFGGARNKHVLIRSTNNKD